MQKSACVFSGGRFLSLGASRLVIAILLMTAYTADAEWPRWRGVDGSGVSSASGLPETWGRDSANIRWRSPIPGEGISSPIVRDGRIFLTTAYPGSEHARLDDLARWITVSLAFLACALIARQFGTTGTAVRVSRATLSRTRHLARSSDRIRVAMAWVLFVSVTVLSLMKHESSLFQWMVGSGWVLPPVVVLLALLATIAAWGWRRAPSLWHALASVVLCVAAIMLIAFAWPPTRYVLLPASALLFAAVVITDARQISSLNAGSGSRSLTVAAWLDSIVVTFAIWTFLAVASINAIAPAHFWNVGEPGPIWLNAGLISSLGLIAAVGWFSPSSWLRVIGAGMLLLFAALLFYNVRMDLFGNYPPRSAKLFAAAPALGAACWYIFAFALWRWRAWTETTRHAPRLLVVTTLVALAGLVFVPPNFLQPVIGMHRVVLCLDLKTGAVLWESPVFLASLEPKYRTNSYATPTPATDGRHIVAHFGSGTAGLDYSGRVLWTVIDRDYHRTTVYGAGSSPVIVGDLAIVVQESEKYTEGGEGKVRRATYIAAYDVRSGRTTWRIEPEDNYDSYATPLVVPRDGVTELLTVTSRAIMAYDVASGRRLWSYPVPVEQTVPSMVRDGDQFWLAAGTHGLRGLVSLRIGGHGIPPSIETIWQDVRAVPEVSSPVVYDGKLFTVTLNGIMSCYDARTGELKWRQRLPRGQYFSSLVAGDGKVYASSETGITSVVAAAGEFKMLAQNHLAEEIYASPAIAEGCFLIRTTNSLYCIARDAARTFVRSSR